MSDTSFITIINLLRAHGSLQQRLASGLASFHGVDTNEAMLLFHLERAPLYRLTRVDLAKRLYVNPSTVTRMTAPMEKLGLVSRQADARDARLAYVKLTPAGQRLAEEIRTTLQHRSEDFFRDRWSQKEIETLAALLARLTANEFGEF